MAVVLTGCDITGRLVLKWPVCLPTKLEVLDLPEAIENGLVDAEAASESADSLSESCWDAILMIFVRIMAEEEN